jgi:hypothetical protein
MHNVQLWQHVCERAVDSLGTGPHYVATRDVLLSVYVCINCAALLQAHSHELGHNLFMGHAGSISSTGVVDE